MLMGVKPLRSVCLSFFFAGLALMPLATVGCNKQQDAATTADIPIGHFASKTGDTATFGVSADEGIILAQDEINAKGGVLGKKVRVITEDDRSQADEAKTVVNKLITQDHVVALLGEIASSRSIAAAPVAQDAQIPMLSPGSTNPKVTQQGDYIFRACFIDPFQGTAMAKFAMDNLKLKRFAILYPANSDYGVGLRDYFKQAILQGGGEIVADLGYTEKSDVDFGGQLTKIKAANPDAIFVPGYYTEAGLIARQARELGILVPLLGGDGWDSDQTLKIGKDAVNGCYFTNHYSPDQDSPQVKSFVAAYEQRYKSPDGSPKVPDAMAILGYDAMRLMCDAIQRAGSTDGAKIRDALAATKDFPGAAGTITIDKDRNAQKPIVVIKIDAGRFTFVTSINP